MSYIYKDEHVLGFDIGRSSIKIMQIEPAKKIGGTGTIVAYGNTTFPESTIEKGVIVNPEVLIKSAYDLIENKAIGEFSTRHVAISLPNSHSFSRIVTLPQDIKPNDLDAAIQAELAQSIPVPIDELHYDYDVTNSPDEGDLEIHVVASPKKIVNSYIDVVEALGLVPAVVEPNINSVTRIVVDAEAHDEVSLIIDLGSTAADLSVYDGNVVRITGTVDCGGDNITKAIASSLKMSEDQAHNIKTRYGIEVSKRQADILKAIEPELDKLVREVKKVIRYYSERADEDRQIGQVIILGGGANLPGLSGYITNKTRLPTRLCAPWSNLSFGKLQPPHELETTLFTTAAGLALITPQEITE